jgi:hypothetical protein
MKCEHKRIYDETMTLELVGLDQVERPVHFPIYKD